MSAELVDGGGQSVRRPRHLVAAPERRGAYARWGKPVLDRAVAGAALAALLPMVLLVALVVLAEFGRPVLFRQRRVGLHGRHFTVYKFRTMLEDRRTTPSADWDGVCRRQTHKSDDDPRHTRVGRLLRKTSLDELPQLWNVLVGDMSLVGPRPELVSVVERYEPWQHRRHAVKPGLTGLWQVTARGDRPMHELTHIDLEYVASVSARNDLKLLLATPRALLSRSGS